MVALAEREVATSIKLRNGVWRAFNDHSPELLVEGPARTGKTFGLLLRMVRKAQSVPGYRGLIVRKVAVTLGSTVLRTLEEQVFHEWDSDQRRSALDHVHFFGGSKNEPSWYEFDNGSRIVVGGMDQASKILGSEYDDIYANEVIEFTVEDVETLLSRLSHGFTNDPAFYSDCNPTYERHWVLQRALSGQMRRIKTTLRDNPAFFDDDGNPTPRGEAYLQSISGLTGTRYQRLVLGEWVGMENAIYPQLPGDGYLAALPDNVQWAGKAATGVDYGESPTHPSAVVTVTESTSGVYWVRACWAETGGNTDHIASAVAAHHTLYRSRAVRTDPTIRAYADVMGWKTALMGAGTRKARIGMVTELLDAHALHFDIDGPGVQELFDEAVMYRYEVKETDTMIEDVVVRKGEDRVAALEYAVEALKLGEGTGGQVFSYA